MIAIGRVVDVLAGTGARGVSSPGKRFCMEKMPDPGTGGAGFTLDLLSLLFAHVQSLQQRLTIW